MRYLKFILLIYVLSCEIFARADDAQKLFEGNEYLQAARLYKSEAGDALAAENYSVYLEDLLYEGECYYKLNLIRDLEKSVETVKTAYVNYASNISDSERKLLIEEGLYKLEGSYNTLSFHTDTSRYASALEAYHKANSVIDELDKIGHDEPSLRVDLYRDEANLYYSAKEYRKALELCNTVCEFYEDNGLFEPSESAIFQRYYNLTVDAFRSRAIIKARLNDFEGAIADIKQIKDYQRNPSLQRTIGKILMMQYDYTNKDTRAEAKKCYEAFIKDFKSDLKKNLSSMTEGQREQYWLSIHDFLFDCYRLEDYAPEMLYDLALFAKGYLINHRSDYKWRDVRDKLATDACAVEFVQYNGKNDRKQLGALVVTSKSLKPRFVPVLDVNEFERIQLSGGISVGEAIRNDYPIWKNSLYNESTLGAKIWTDELMNAIGPAKKVYFSPDGLLHVLAIEYMNPDSLREFHRLSSTRVIIDSPKINISNVLVCGDIDFTTSNGNIVYRENDETAYRMLENDGAYFQNLPGTEAEIDSISTELAVQQGGYKIKVLRGAEATDARFCEMSRKSELVHLATHGFFTGTIQNSELVPAISDNSLSESGLAMAGVNANLRNESFDVTQYDGILTAKELSAQDLSHVQMMVLSACQTGLGYISDDGVYGIQRGLKTSGVGAMTLSLWSVDDFATCELMRRFYERLSLQGACPDIYRAFMTARKSIMDDGVVDVYKFSAGKLASQRTSLGINKPQYTNAFILIDVL